MRSGTPSSGRSFLYYVLVLRAGRSGDEAVFNVRFDGAWDVNICRDYTRIVSRQILPSTFIVSPLWGRYCLEFCVCMCLILNSYVKQIKAFPISSIDILNRFINKFDIVSKVAINIRIRQ